MSLFHRFLLLPSYWWSFLPKGLFLRSLIIIVAPMVILQSVVAFVFMERHWQTVTKRLSASVTREIAAIIAIMDQFPDDPKHIIKSIEIAKNQLEISASMLQEQALPGARPKPYFDLLDRTLSSQIRRNIGKPFWVDTVGDSGIMEVRILLDQGVLRLFLRRSRAYASNSHIFLVWMVGTSLVLILMAILFLRNQIRPIQQLADAADGFGKGREIPDHFKPRGAREVRRAGDAFVRMGARIERQIAQRTTMLAGVSHDLRTILTRFRLQIAMIADASDSKELRQDIEDMERILDDYLAFAKGDSGEMTQRVDFRPLVESVLKSLAVDETQYSFHYEGVETAVIRPNAIKRCILNILQNAAEYGTHIWISCKNNDGQMMVVIEDNGPGVPESARKDVLSPFHRMDTARNQDRKGTGLGLAIALDVARSHGGKLWLDLSRHGGLKVTVLVPT